MKKLIKLSLLFILCVMGTVCFAVNHAMWVWDYRDAVDTSKRQEMFDFCKAKDIQTLFLQIPYETKTMENGTDSNELKKTKELHEFLEDAHQHGIRVDALDGDPKFVLKEWHPYVLDQVDAILAFNKEGKPNQGFDGIHYDIEPKFKEGQRESICLQYLDLISAIADKIKKSNQKVILGLDIPFWYDENRDDQGKLLYEVSWEDNLKTMDQHLLDLVDEVAIMDYRTQALGENGAIHHAQGEINYANSIHKKVWVGLETSEQHGDPPSISFFGRSESDFDRVADAIIKAFQKSESFQGIAIHYYESYKSLTQSSKK
jgi:hypothetical protein